MPLDGTGNSPALNRQILVKALRALPPDFRYYGADPCANVPQYRCRITT
jgi:hypothetical protein